jgi:quercetin dioxygenase-like cupin family protein
VRRWPASEVATRSKGRGVTLRDLVPEPVPDEMMEVLDFAPGAVMAGTPHLPGTREFFTCLDGSVNIMVAGDRHALATGDVLAFPGNLPHSYQNADPLAPRAGSRSWSSPRPASEPSLQAASPATAPDTRLGYSSRLCSSRRRHEISMRVPHGLRPDALPCNTVR